MPTALTLALPSEPPVHLAQTAQPSLADSNQVKPLP